MNVGTPLWMAPEMQSESISRKVDVFSFGVILYQIVEGISSDKLEAKLQTGLTFSPDTRAEIRYLIEDCVQKEPSSRPEFLEILEELEQMYFEIGNESDREKTAEYYSHIKQASLRKM